MSELVELLCRTVTIDELLEQEGYDAVFIGTGAGLPQFMNIPGEEGPEGEAMISAKVELTQPLSQQRQFVARTATLSHALSRRFCA